MIPKRFIESGTELANGASLYGVMFEDMTREELIAAAAHGWNEQRKAQKEFAETAKARAHLFADEARIKSA